MLLSCAGCCCLRKCKDEIREQCRDFWVEDGARLPKFVHLEVRKQRAAASVAPPVESHVSNAGTAANGGNEQAAPPAHTSLRVLFQNCSHSVPAYCRLVSINNAAAFAPADSFEILTAMRFALDSGDLRGFLCQVVPD